MRRRSARPRYEALWERHLFNDNECLWRNLLNGFRDAGQFRYCQRIKPYITRLVLEKSVQIACVDETGAQRVIKMSRLPELANGVLGGAEERSKLKQFVENAFSAFAHQYNRIRSLIQSEAQTYMALPLIPNPTPTFLVRHLNGDVQKIVARGLVALATRRSKTRFVDSLFKIQSP